MKLSLFGSAMAVAAATMTGPGHAQTASDPNKGAPDSVTGSALPSDSVTDIIVTANRRNERQRDVANSVTAISGEDLSRRNEIRLQDLIGQVPGLSAEETSPTLVRVILRGLNAGSAGSTVASVLDDVPINTAGGVNNGSVTQPNPDTYDIKRIEVLRGPQSSLYGATAEGGLIKYVTNGPELNRFYGSAEAGIDGLTAGGIGGSLKGFVNIPLIDDIAALRITATNTWIPGYIDDPLIGKTDYNSGQQYSYRASLLVKPTEDLTVRLFAQRQSVFSNGLNAVQAVGAAQTPATPPPNQLDILHGLVNNAPLPLLAQTESGQYYADLEYDFGAATLTSLTSYVFNSVKVRTDLSDEVLFPGTIYATYLGPVYGRPTVSVGEVNRFDTGKFNQEVRLSSDPGTKIAGLAVDWQGGVFYTHESTTLSQEVDIFAPPDRSTQLTPVAGSVAVPGSFVEWAVFGQATLHLTDDVSVDLGGRYGGNDQHTQTQYVQGLLTGPTRSNPIATSNEHYALYNVAPRWRIDGDTLAYLRIATGYRPGGPNFPVPGVTGLPTSYHSDRTVNYEIGIRRDFFDKAVTADLTGFYVNWSQVQILSVVQTPQGPFAINGNAGAATSRGVEWSLSWRPLPGLQLAAAGSYTDARLTSDAAALGARSGDFLPFVPDVSNSVNIDYSWAAFRDYEAFVSGSWTFVGDRYTGFSPSTTVITPHVVLPGYHTGSVRAGIENDRYGAELYIENISDARGITTYGNNGGSNFTGQVTLIQPRTIGATVRVKF